ncbi:MAG: acetyl-CoA carboxylase biotin carboxyl carrier protein subunit [Bryobacteraceae bacterium]
MKLKITVNDKLYEVEVEASEPEPQQPVYLPPTPTRIGAAPVVAPPAAAGGPPVENEDKVCRSPIAGTVTRVLAQPGQTIQPGDVLLVLEAMKMETNITAPIAGKIASLPVKAGDAVQGGQVLVAFE